MTKKHFRLQHSESVVVQAAAQIYAAYISVGRVADGEEATWMKRSIREAITIAEAADNAVISDEEIDTMESQGLGVISVGRTPPKQSRHRE
jgi:hypothetical protein